MKPPQRLLPVASTIAVLSLSSSAQTTVRASVDSAGAQANSFSNTAAISADGRYVALTSDASNLVPGDTNGKTDVFVRDLLGGSTVRVSVDSNGAQGTFGGSLPSISADGRYVAFSSSSHLVPNAFGTHVYVHDLSTGATTLASVDSNGVQGDGSSNRSSISADGRYVAFESLAQTLVAGDTNGRQDIFVHDRLTGNTTRVSVDSAGLESNANSFDPSISADGRYVAFDSLASNLVPGDTNTTSDVFVHDRVSGSTIRASVSSNGAQGIGGVSLQPALSADGRTVVFRGPHLVLGAPAGQIYAHDLSTGETTVASVDSNGLPDMESSPGDSSSISADGRFVAFQGRSDFLPGGVSGSQDIFVHDRLTGATVRASVGSSAVDGNDLSFTPSISADGRRVAFTSLATNLVHGDTNGAQDTFVHDQGPASAFASFCSGDGVGAACPCNNNGSPGHGCDNSAATGGALLTVTGIASLATDAVQLTASGELATALSIVLQGDTSIAPTAFGDGLRCAGGALRRLYGEHASGGTVVAPQSGDPSISTQSAALGDPIPLGATRTYQVYYRDSNLTFCAGGFNVTNAIAIAWGS